MSKKKIIKGIIETQHVYGIKFFKKNLYLSNVFKKFISKIKIDNYKKLKLNNIKKGWRRFQFLSNDSDNYNGIHSIDFINQNLFFIISYLNKKLLLLDLLKKKNL